jgi:TPR repeat protein
MKRLILTAVLLLATGVWAGPLEDASAAYARGDYAAELRITRPLAAKGEAWAQGFLGSSYGNGHGVIQDYAEAAKWYKLAVAQGNANALHNLGWMYYNGQGVLQDYGEALRLIRLAAAKASESAYYQLGWLYGWGGDRGVVSNDVLAHMWLNLAAAKGVAEAVKSRDTVTLRLDARQLAEAQKLAREFIDTPEAGRIDFMKAAEQKYAVQERQNRRESEARVAAEMRRDGERVAAEKLAEDKKEKERDTVNFLQGFFGHLARPPQNQPPPQPTVTCTTLNHGGRTTTTCN